MGDTADVHKTPLVVTKRDGTTQPWNPEKIRERIIKMLVITGVPEALDDIDITLVVDQVVHGVADGMTTVQIDELAAEAAASLASENPHYGLLGARLAVGNLHKQTKEQAHHAYMQLAAARCPRTGRPAPAVTELLVDYATHNAPVFNQCVRHDRDFRFSYEAVRSWEKTYLLKSADGRIRERIQHLYLRVAIALAGPATHAAWSACTTAEQADMLDNVRRLYETLSMGLFTVATPTLFNAGTVHPRMSSCFLLPISDDSVRGIMETISRCAIISQCSGGIGVSVSNIRSEGSDIRNTSGGTSRGLVPFMRILDATAKCVDQGRRRPGAIAMYIEPHHPDLLSFLELRRQGGTEDTRCRDLFQGLWISDLFMERVEAGGMWAFFSPDDAPDLVDLWGPAYKSRYEAYESARPSIVRAQMPARDVWDRIMVTILETGMPYMLFKDAANAKSNQQNLGTIRSSNLCTVRLVWGEGGGNAELTVSHRKSSNTRAPPRLPAATWRRSHCRASCATRTHRRRVSITPPSWKSCAVPRKRSTR